MLCMCLLATSWTRLSDPLLHGNRFVFLIALLSCHVDMKYVIHVLLAYHSHSFMLILLSLVRPFFLELDTLGRHRASWISKTHVRGQRTSSRRIFKMKGLLP